MRVKVIEGRRGDRICRFDGITGLFDRLGPQPEVGSEIEVMFCVPIYPKRGEDGSTVQPITTFVLRPVTTEDILVEHMGFETAGSMCCTTANVTAATRRQIKEATGKDFGWITPGRTPIIDAHNVNAAFDRRAPTPRTKGKAFLSIKDIKAGRRRIIGVPELELLRPDIRERMKPLPC